MWRLLCSDSKPPSRIDKIRIIHWSKIIIYIWLTNGLIEFEQFSKKKLEITITQSRWCHCGGSHPTVKFFRQQQKEKGYKKITFNPHNSNNKHNKRNGWKPNTWFRWGSEDHFIVDCLKPDTMDKKVHWKKENPKTCAYILMKIDKTLENITYKSKS